MIKRTIVGLAAAAALTSTAGAASAGCLTGAVVGGVAGHYAGHHPFLGAAAGCAVGHHLAVVHKRQIRAQRAAARGY